MRLLTGQRRRRANAVHESVLNIAVAPECNYSATLVVGATYDWRWTPTMALLYVHSALATFAGLGHFFAPAAMWKFLFAIDDTSHSLDLLVGLSPWFGGVMFAYAALLCTAAKIADRGVYRGLCTTSAIALAVYCWQLYQPQAGNLQTAPMATKQCIIISLATVAIATLEASRAPPPKESHDSTHGWTSTFLYTWSTGCTFSALAIAFYPMQTWQAIFNVNDAQVATLSALVPWLALMFVNIATILCTTAKIATPVSMRGAAAAGATIAATHAFYMAQPVAPFKPDVLWGTVFIDLIVMLTALSAAIVLAGGGAPSKRQ